jgi:hypothetical protein
MNIQTLNQVGLEVAEAVSEWYGCSALGFEAGRRDGDSIWVKLTLSTDKLTDSEFFKIPLHLAYRLTGAQHVQARLELVDLLQRSFKNFTGGGDWRH